MDRNTKTKTVAELKDDDEENPFWQNPSRVVPFDGDGGIEVLDPSDLQRLVPARTQQQRHDQFSFPGSLPDSSDDKTSKCMPSDADSKMNSLNSATHEKSISQEDPRPELDPPQANDPADSGDDDDDDDDEKVQIVSPPPAQLPSSHPSSSPQNRVIQKEMRRKNRRRLFRLLKNPDVTPSFLRLIEGPSTSIKGKGNRNECDVDDDSSDDGDFLLAPPIVVIDVDEYLGLKKRRLPDPIESTLANGIFAPNRKVTSSSLQKHEPGSFIPHAASSSSLPPNVAASPSADPAEDGWYEGVLPTAQSEDVTYLTDMQQWTRQNLEYFSATEQDILMNQPGRRTPTVRGKVGIRCIHCAKAVRERMQQDGLNPEQGGAGTKISWPAGSVSYPLNISGLYSVAIQKPQLHFENCPNMPPDSRLTAMLARSRASQLGTAHGSGGSLAAGTKRKRMKEGMSALLYWTVSCHRVGLVEVAGNGIRFGRDLSIDPLPFETTRIKVEQEHPELVPKPAQMGFGQATKSGGSGGSPAPDRIQSLADSKTGSGYTVTPIKLTKEVSDVLDEAKKEEDDPARLLARQEDQHSLSSFMFLTAKQAAICHASKEDFSTRGKKTKLMRVGFTGFCCRHCKKNYPPDIDAASHVSSGVLTAGFQYSCRSFSSSHENLASAMSNSFVLHLLKCIYTPRSIKQALQTLKRMHQRQMQQLPYGSQSRVFMQMWERARAADRTQAPSEALEDTHNDNDYLMGEASSDVDDAPEVEDDEEFVPDNEASPLSDTELDTSVTPHRVGSASVRTPAPARRSVTNLDSSAGHARASAFPAVDDEETKQLLKDVEADWDPEENDRLILPEDRNLISDFVFLCMRQLKVAHPTPADFKGNRRNNVVSRMAGLCCIHCAENHDHQHIKPSGRSFPSAPDNLASALNSSLYNHMLNCPDLPAPLRRAMEIVRKLHSVQCSSLVFGSQRRYFNKLYARLKAVPVEYDLAAPVQDVPVFRDKHTYSVAVQKYAFLHRTGSGGTRTNSKEYWQCQKCRMVPFDYRSSGSLHFECPEIETMKRHFETCQNDGMIWDDIQGSMKQLERKYGERAKVTGTESFKNLVRSVVGNSVFEGVMEILEEVEKSPSQNGRSVWRQLPITLDFREVETAFSSMVQELKLESNNLNDHPDILRFLQLLSCNLQVPLPRNADGDINHREIRCDVMSESTRRQEDEFEATLIGDASMHNQDPQNQAVTTLLEHETMTFKGDGLSRLSSSSVGAAVTDQTGVPDLALHQEDSIGRSNTGATSSLSAPAATTQRAIHTRGGSRTDVTTSSSRSLGGELLRVQAAAELEQLVDSSNTPPTLEDIETFQGIPTDPASQFEDP